MFFLQRFNRKNSKIKIERLTSFSFHGRILILKKFEKKIKKNELFSRIVSFEDNLILPDFFGRNDENLKKLENALTLVFFQEVII